MASLLGYRGPSNVVGFDIPEPGMTGLLLNALAPYSDYPEVRAHMDELRRRRQERWPMKRTDR